MIRRLVRFAIAAFCLLSLLVALGVSWLWWECRHGRGYVADDSINGMYVMPETNPGGRAGVLAMRGWPRPPTFRLWSHLGYYFERPIHWSASLVQPWHRFHLSGQSGAWNTKDRPKLAIHVFARKPRQAIIF
jgi:hypothetical protein